MNVLLALVVEGDLQAQFDAIVAATDAARTAAIESASSALVAFIRTEKLSGAPIHRRSGALAESISSEVQHSDGATTGTISSSAAYAPILEFGGQISAHAAAHLAIPLSALFGDAPEVIEPRALLNDPASLGFVGTFIRNDILFGSSAGREISPLFKLQASVEIPARSFFASSLDENRDEILKLLRVALAQAL